MKAKFLLMASALALATAACSNSSPTASEAPASAPAAQSAAAPGMTYASLAELPDFSGPWGAAMGPPPASQGRPAGGPPDIERMMREIPPLKDPEQLQKYKDALAIYAQGGDNIANAASTALVQGGGGGGAANRAQASGRGSSVYDLGGGLCGMNPLTGGFNGRTSGGPESMMEILFTPGRVTLTTDRGVIRRIYTDGRPVPGDVFATRMGTSVGHWEGDTLIVDTVGLSPDTILAGGVKAGEGWSVRERIYKSDDGRLHIDGTITAPETYSEPYNYTQVYQHPANSKVMLAEYLTPCGQVDRSIDPTTRKQSFDLTPPSDLPPPPSE